MTTPSVLTKDFAGLYPFTSHFHSIDSSLKLHYVDEGEGEPLVMVHGNPTWSFYFRHLINAFKEDYRVLVPDHIGCGLSDKPQDYSYCLKNHIENLDSLLTAKGLDQITLVLHDWGGCIGMGYALKHPEKIRRLVFLNTAAFLIPDIRKFPKLIRVNRIPFFGAFSIRGLNLFVKIALKLASSKPERMTSEVCAGYKAPYNSYANRIAIHRFVQDIPLHKSHPTYPVVEEIEKGLDLFKATPKLICWGRRDFCFNDSFLNAWKEKCPEAEYALYEDANHYVLEDAHERVIERLHTFFKQHPLS
jgi:pimeloyl-ACP methyl ester carboxylesterase